MSVISFSRPHSNRPISLSLFSVISIDPFSLFARSPLLFCFSNFPHLLCFLCFFSNFPVFPASSVSLLSLFYSVTSVISVTSHSTRPISLSLFSICSNFSLLLDSVTSVFFEFPCFPQRPLSLCFLSLLSFFSDFPISP